MTGNTDCEGIIMRCNTVVSAVGRTRSVMHLGVRVTIGSRVARALGPATIHAA